LRICNMPALLGGLCFGLWGILWGLVGDSHITLRLLRWSMASRIAPNSGCW